jgi:hypothetical protein
VDQKAALALLCVLVSACGRPSEARLRDQLKSLTSGSIQLPSGVLEAASELVLAPGAHDVEIFGSHTTLKAAPGFSGRAMLVLDGASNVRVRDLAIDGSRGAAVEDMVPPENALRVWYRNNGILADRAEGLEISRVSFSNIAGFAVIASRSSKIRIHDVTVLDSGSKNAQGRNNLSGGILIEEGSDDFQVTGSTFRNILGNGLWTHSLRTSPRLANGVFSGNHFDTIGRDALQVGHATRVRVENNAGSNIGYPVDVVDIEHGGTPVAIDTAGNVDYTEYAANSFDEVNGKCIDLDGFHHGIVRDNTCRNAKRVQDYPHGHFGIVMNNTDPSAHSQGIELRNNTIDGAKFGGLFLMGSGNRIEGNRFLRLNLAGCNESAKEFNCIYKPDEPHMLESGIYLGRGVARMEETRGNTIRGNTLSGHRMNTRCIAAGAGVSLAGNTVAGNTCIDDWGR